MKQTSESITNIVAAIIATMGDVKNIEKNMNVGTGSSSYKGVADKDVKVAVGSAMQKNGLSIVPINVDENTDVVRWMESGQYGEKQKSQVFCRVKVSYLLSHVSGEWMIISGIGHGVDSQDKAAGKATTYALKYALLYSFMIPTGNIDDADNEHSDTKEVPPAKTKTKPALQTDDLEKIKGIARTIKAGAYTLADYQKKYDISKECELLIMGEVQSLKEADNAF